MVRTLAISIKIVCSIVHSIIFRLVVAQRKRAHGMFCRFKVDWEDDYTRRVIEDMQANLQTKYGTTPTFFNGTLQQALNAASGSDSLKDVRLTLYF